MASTVFAKTRIDLSQAIPDVNDDRTYIKPRQMVTPARWGSVDSAAGRNVHERGLARSVLAEESVHLPGVPVEFRVVENNDAVKGLSNSLESKARCHKTK
jgi:hypothetical protein